MQKIADQRKVIKETGGFTERRAGELKRCNIVYVWQLIDVCNYKVPELNKLIINKEAVKNFDLFLRTNSGVSATDTPADLMKRAKALAPVE